MSKHNALKFWKETIVRAPKKCDKCRFIINPDEIYFSERLKDPRINFIGKKLCKDCYKLEARQTLSGS